MAMPYETYRISDPIENLQLQVVLRKKKAIEMPKPTMELQPKTEGKSVPSRRRGLQTDSGTAAEEEPLQKDEHESGTGRTERRRRGRSESQTAGAPNDSGAVLAGKSAESEEHEEDDDTEEVARATFRWQAKVFGRSEVKGMRHAAEEQAARRGSGVFSRLLNRGNELQVSHRAAARRTMDRA